MVAEVPPYEIINKQTISMFVMIHPEQLVCKKCGQEFQFLMTGVKDLQYGWRAVAPKVEENPEAITPPKRPIDFKKVQ